MIAPGDGDVDGDLELALQAPEPDGGLVADQRSSAAEEGCRHAEPVRAQVVMADREDAAVPGMQAPDRDHPVDGVPRVAEVVQLLAGDDPVLLCRQHRHPVMTSKLISHAGSRAGRLRIDPPSRPRTRGKTRISRESANSGGAGTSLGSGERRGNICSPG